MSVRKYEALSCPDHGQERMLHGQCGVVLKQRAGVTTFCHKRAFVTAYDARDVKPLLDALDQIERETRSVYIQTLAAEALEPFATQPEEEQR